MDYFECNVYRKYDSGHGLCQCIDVSKQLAQHDITLTFQDCIVAHKTPRGTRYVSPPCIEHCVSLVWSCWPAMG